MSTVLPPDGLLLTAIGSGGSGAVGGAGGGATSVTVMVPFIVGKCRLQR
jgi:hypothetical protein